MTELITPTGVLVMSAEQMKHDHAGWLKARRWRDVYDVLTNEQVTEMGIEQAPAFGYRIGSSEVPSILDLDGVDTPAHVWRNKVLGVATPVNEAMDWGHLFEPVIAERWQQLNRTVVDEIGLVAHVGKPWHQSTIDRRVLECPLVKGLRNDCGLEVKNVGYASAARWHADIPDRILAQIVHQLFVTGYPHMHYACNIGGNTMRQGVVYAEREAELMEYIVGEVDGFRERYLLTGVEPDWDVTSKPGKMIALDKATHPERAGELTVPEIGEVIAYSEAQAREAFYGKRKEQAKAKLAQLADGAQVMLFADHEAYRYTKSERTAVDLDKLKERHPAAYADPEVVSQNTSYTLRIAREYKTTFKGEE